jgi:hypothetical protein
VAAVLALIAIFGFFRLETAHVPFARGASSPIAPTILARLDLGPGPRRGEVTVPLLRLPAGAGTVEVTFIVPGGGEDATVRIEDDGRRPIAPAAPAPAPDAMGRMQVIVPAAAFQRSGLHALVLAQRDEAGGAPIEYRYPFLYLKSAAATNPAR